jgi:hypothetical protein
MAVEGEPGIFKEIVGALMAGLSAAFWWGWNHTHKRIDTVETTASTKADHAEHLRTKGHVESIFEKIEEMKETFNNRLNEMERRNNDQHQQLLAAIYERNGHP